jgi:hypothetical protein
MYMDITDVHVCGPNLRDGGLFKIFELTIARDRRHA